MGLLPGALTPQLAAAVVRLGSWVPFGQAVALLAALLNVRVSEALVRRRTEAAGAAYEAAQAAEAERVVRQAPPPPAGPPVLQLSADGAMVPLVGGEWGEVKTLAIGEVVADPSAPDGVRTERLSYFSRRAEAAAFIQQATVEVHRRGVETAGLVALLVDGSPWCQGVADVHRPDAVRVLDFPHAVEHLSAAAQACWGAGTAAAQAWLAEQAHELKHEDPAAVLAAVGGLPVAAAADPAAAAAARDETLGYLEARWEQIQYASVRGQGLAIGSGAVESANKRVILARMKGAGMRWAPAHVNPLAALRTAVCSDRWDEAWGQVEQEARRRRRARTDERRAGRRAAARAGTGSAPAPPPAPPPALDEADPRYPEAAAPAAGRPKLVVNGRPTAAHPWKRHRCLPPPPTPLPAHPKL